MDYVWDANAPMPVVLEDSSNNRLVYGLDLLARIDSLDEEWYLPDGLGSTTFLTDSSGDVTGSYEYGVFGVVRSHSGDSTEWSFAKEQVDPTGLQYLRARYYDSNNGRLLSKDRVPTSNRYNYVNNNPVTYDDPSGDCRIEVHSEEKGYVLSRAKHVNLPFGRRITWSPEVSVSGHHLFLVSYDPTGSTRAYRVGSSRTIPLGGMMDVDRGPWNDQFTDWGDTDDKVTVLNNYESCARYWSTFDRVSDEVDGKRLYQLFSKNSNSFIRALLEAAGPPVEVEHPGGYTPGWGNSLGYERD